MLYLKLRLVAVLDHVQSSIGVCWYAETGEGEFVSTVVRDPTTRGSPFSWGWKQLQFRKRSGQFPETEQFSLKCFLRGYDKRFSRCEYGYQIKKTVLAESNRLIQNITNIRFFAVRRCIDFMTLSMYNVELWNDEWIMNWKVSGRK
jgi:hypothetical protein